VPMRLGAGLDPDGVTLTFGVFSAHATRIEAWIYRRPRDEVAVARVLLKQPADDGTDRPDSNGIWITSISLESLPWGGDPVYYGLRAWGPNWTFDPGWRPGNELGFRADVDADGNRFNPNKLLVDPYAKEISHDPAPRLSGIDPNEPSADYDTGPAHRRIDTGPVAPKAVLSRRAPVGGTGERPRRPLGEDVLYEVHVRGFTRLDPAVPERLRGTYAGAGLKASYLRDLGVTAVELLPVQHFASEQNDDSDPRGDNYWGYMPLAFFAPNRRYAADRSPGGPVLEFKAMVRAFHEAGIKVLLDIVFNHTGEGLLARTTESDDSRVDDALQLPDRTRLLSFRGLDNATYYTLRGRPDLDGGRPNQRYVDVSGCGPALAVTRAPVRRLIEDVLRYWVEEMGVDGFRFDLAPALGNRLAVEGFAFDGSDPHSLVQVLGYRLPLRTEQAPDGVDLIAEPWLAQGSDTYQLGRFPPGWAHWNDVYRQTVRRTENAFRVASVRPWELANALSGSQQQFSSQALPGLPGGTAGPASSLNYVSAHDGLTLRDLFSYTGGGEAWDHDGDPVAQRQAVRNALVMLAVSAGIPMIQAGDELFRTLEGRDNTVAVDDPTTWLHWDGVDALGRARQAGGGAALAAALARDDVRIYLFARAMLRFRSRHPALRPVRWFTGTVQPGGTLPDVTWHAPDGGLLTEGWNDPDLGFLGYRVAEPPGSVYMAFLWRDEPTDVVLPTPQLGACWRRVADTAAWMEPLGNVDSQPGPQIASGYGMHPRSVAVFVETPVP